MNHLTAIAVSILIFFFSMNSAVAESEPIELPECVVITHCVLENLDVTEVEKSFSKVLKAVTNTPRTKIIEKTNSYIHAEAKTKWRRYTDDLLIKALPERGILQIRSESRVGIGDNGVNKKRVDELAYRLMTDQIN